MTKPKRIQRRRVKGWRMPSTAIYVGRGTPWGNPYTVEEHGRDEAIALYRAHLADFARRSPAAYRHFLGPCHCRRNPVADLPLFEKEPTP